MAPEILFQPELIGSEYGGMFLELFRNASFHDVYVIRDTRWIG